MGLAFRILGPLEVGDGDTELDLGGSKQRSLLVVLLLNRGESVSTDRLVDALWGEAPSPNAAKTLQVYISRLRRVLGDGHVTTRGAGYAFEADADSIDASRFERLAAEGRERLAAGDSAGAAATLRDALALWRGPAFDDLAYEEFVQAAAVRLEELRLGAIEERIEADLRLGRHAEVAAELDALVRAHPLRERLRAQQMLALYRCRRQADALEAYREARRALTDELGLEPGPDLRELEHAILTHDPSLAAPATEAPTPIRRGRRGRRAMAAVVGAALAAGALVAAVTLTDGRGHVAGLDLIPADSVVVIDPQSNAPVAAVPVGAAPTALVVAGGSAWAADAGDQTLTRIDARAPKVVARIGLGRIPTALAASARALWVGDAIGFRGIVSKVDPVSRSVVNTTTVRVGDDGDAYAPPTPTSIAIGGGYVWTNRVRQKLARFPIGGGPVEFLDLGAAHSADAVAVGRSGVWVASSADDKVLRVDASTFRVTGSVAVAARRGSRVAGPHALALGFGSVWVADTLADTVSRIDPHLGVATATIRVGHRPTRIVVGEGAVWVLNGGDGSVTRIDPQRNAAEATIAVRRGATDVAAGAGRVWVTVAGGAPVAGARAPVHARPVRSDACGAMLHGVAAPQVLIASDLPTYDYDRTSPVMRAAHQAIRAVLAQSGWHAGRFALGYQECDDSTKRDGTSSPARCAANARAYASERSLVGVIGSYHSSCTAIELPLLNAAPGGPIAMVSPSNTYDGLTRAGPATSADEPERYYPVPVRNFARITAPDSAQGAALSLLARRLGARRLFLLDDGQGTGYAMTRYVTDAARRLGLTVAGSAHWLEHSRGYSALARRVARSRPDAVVLTGCLCLNGPALVAALRDGLPASTRFLGSDNFTGLDDVFAQPHGEALEGLYVTFAGRPRRGRDLEAALAGDATRALLGAIARSNGTRASIVEALLRSGHFDAHGDPSAPVIGVYRFSRRAPFGTAHSLDRLAFERVLEPGDSLLAR